MSAHASSHPYACERARAFVSLRLDGELSELEHALLAAHLERCSTCHTFALEAAALADHLRTAELEPLTYPITLPSRSRPAWSLRGLQVGAAAVLAVAFAGVGSLFALQAQHESFADRARVALSHAPVDDAGQRELRSIPGMQPGERRVLPVRGTRSLDTVPR